MAKMSTANQIITQRYSCVLARHDTIVSLNALGLLAGPSAFIKMEKAAERSLPQQPFPQRCSCRPVPPAPRQPRC